MDDLNGNGFLYAAGALIHSTLCRQWRVSADSRRLSDLRRKPNRTDCGVRDPTFQLQSENSDPAKRKADPRISLENVFASFAFSHEKESTAPIYVRRFCHNCCDALTTAKSIHNPLYYNPPTKYLPWYTLTRNKTITTLIIPSDNATDFFLKREKAFQQMLIEDGLDQFSKEKFIKICNKYLNSDELDGKCTRTPRCRISRILVRKFANLRLKAEIRVKNNEFENLAHYFTMSSKSFFKSNIKQAPSNQFHSWHCGAPLAKMIPKSKVKHFSFKHVLIFEQFLILCFLYFSI